VSAGTAVVTKYVSELHDMFEGCFSYDKERVATQYTSRLGYWLHAAGLNSGKEDETSRPALGTTAPPVQRAPGLFPVGKWTTQLSLMPKSRMSGDVPLRLLYAFIACEQEYFIHDHPPYFVYPDLLVAVCETSYWIRG
jgi:hypothetical protein